MVRQAIDVLRSVLIEYRGDADVRDVGDWIG
jgi:hypothetical protein